MKLKNILYIGVAALAMTACNDYLDVDAPSKSTPEFVFSKKSEIEVALNGVYAQALAGDIYGNAYQRTFILNSDVDFIVNSSNTSQHNTYARLDCDAMGGDINKFWTAAYRLIEYANQFIGYTEASPIYDKDDAQLMQWVGEAKCLRAMMYHDLVVMFGDVPFTMTATLQRENQFYVPVVDRQAIQDSLISDLKSIEPYMASTKSTTVERCSKEFAQSLIARIALTAGGYSLRPEEGISTSYGKMVRPANYKDYYKTAMQYAGLVMAAGTHSLTNDYQDVFVKECNYEVVNDDDPIFEIPFARDASGNTGYIQGPEYKAYENKTVGPWGACSGNGRLNAFYRYHFNKEDLRREFVNGLWYYSYYTTPDGSLADSVYIRNDYSVHNNKWSKLWTNENSALGDEKSGNTGINYPYMRYADVLLMYAEAANEVNGAPTDTAKIALKAVRERAFRTAANKSALVDTYVDAITTKEDFLKAVLDERKFEFAGENMRWRDLVRNNMYAEELVYSFLRYYSAAMQNVGGMTGYEDAINEHDGLNYIDQLPSTVYYHAYNCTEPITPVAMRTAADQFYGYTVGGTGINLYFDHKYPNQSRKSLRIYNAYTSKAQPAKSLITNYGLLADGWLKADFYSWGDTNTGAPKDQCKYSFFGFIRSDDNGRVWLVRNGALEELTPGFDPATLPVVRYLLPYPNEAIQRSAGTYQNNYGY